MRIDSHHHFWDYSSEQYAWISDEMSVLQRDFTPAELSQETQALGIDGVVTVQARQTLAETHWLIELAHENTFIRGVVGWIPLADAKVEAVLETLRHAPQLKGVRHVVQDEPDDNFILGEDFNRGVSLLHRYDLVYDILIFAKHLRPSIKFVDQHPEQPFVLDHIAKPTIMANTFAKQWEVDIRDLAKRDNVSCKFSGVVTEVRDENWTIDTLRPYWDVALDAFGAKRLMFGSDWPVCLLRSSYHRWHATVQELAAELSSDEQAAVMGGNAIRVYQL
ncbi:MAG: amidohydrolase family protein [Pirellulaceae bacterium]